MVCLGVEPGVAGWKAQTNPLSYGGTPFSCHFTISKNLSKSNCLFGRIKSNLFFHLFFIAPVKFWFSNSVHRSLSILPTLSLTHSLSTSDASPRGPWSSSEEEGEGLYLPNCQTNFIIALYRLSLLFYKFINTTAYHLGRYKPSSPVSCHAPCMDTKILLQSPLSFRLGQVLVNFDWKKTRF